MCSSLNSMLHPYVSSSSCSSACRNCCAPLGGVGEVVLECGHSFCGECVQDPCPQCEDEDCIKEVELLLQKEKTRLIGLMRSCNKVRDQCLGALNNLPLKEFTAWKEAKEKMKHPDRFSNMQEKNKLEEGKQVRTRPWAPMHTFPSL